MTFSSLNFIFIFLPLMLFLYYLADKKYRNYILLVMSLCFYAYLGVDLLVVLLISISINYLGSYLLHIFSEDRKISKFILAITIILNIIYLGYYKYFDFIVMNINNIFSANIEFRNVIMPIGVSFYTFKAISYLVDVYKEPKQFRKNPLNAALYISFFPQITAGPISRYGDINKQIEHRVENLDKFEDGIHRFCIGLAKKVILSNTFGEVADSIFSLSLNNLNIGYAWIGIAAYTLQIYLDFSGYSDMAIGICKMLGFNILENFNYPYISKSITEFWSIWHISLSSFFKDYIYIPLGGNRVGISRHILNTFIVWLLTGIWHGASWNFVVWGIYYGVIIILEKYLYGKYLKKLPSILQHLYSILLMMIGWVFFRANTLEYALGYIRIMFSFNFDNISYNVFMRYLMEFKIEWFISIVACTPIYYKIFKSTKSNFKLNVERVYTLVLFIISICYVIASTYNSFIYFQF